MVNVPIGALFAIGLVPAAFAFLTAWLVKPHPLRGKMLLLGIRAATETALVRPVNTQRGVYTWKEKGDFKADVHLDNAFLLKGQVLPEAPEELGDKSELKEPDGGIRKFLHLHKMKTLEERALGLKVALVDLETQQPIKYEGICQDDDKAVEVDYFGEKRKLKWLWARLTGVRLYQIRKDLRLKQLAAVASTIWEFMTKVAPFILVFIAVVMVIVLVLLLKAVL